MGLDASVSPTSDASVDGADGGRRLPRFSLVPLAAGLDGTEIVAISGDPNDLWAMQHSGTVLHFDGATFQVAFTLDRTGAGLYVRGERVVLATSNSLYSCTGSCTSLSSFAVTAVRTADILTGLCGVDADRVFAVGTRGPDTSALYDPINASQWLSSPIPVSQALACSAGDDAIYVAGTGGVYVFGRFSGFERLLSNPHPFLSVFAIGNEVHAGADEGRLFRRDADAGTWANVSPPVASAPILAIGGFAADELYAGSSNTEHRAWSWWDGSAWHRVDTTNGDFADRIITVIFTLSPDEMLWGGRTSSGPFILRATR